MSREKLWPAICACGATTELEVKFCAERVCASANGAASFLTIPALEGMRGNLQAILENIVDSDECVLNGADCNWLGNALRLVKQLLQQRIEVSGVVSGHAIEEAHLSKNTTGMAAHVAPALGNEQGGIGTESENSRAGVTTGLTSSLELKPLPEPAIRAPVYGPQSIDDFIAELEKDPEMKEAIASARNSAREDLGIRIAVDPWQGIGKTWSDK